MVLVVFNGVWLEGNGVVAVLVLPIVFTHPNTKTDTLVLPSRARVWAQLIECPELPLHHALPDAATPCVGFRGQPTPLYLAPPSTSGSESSDKASGGGPIPSRALSAPFVLLDVDFADVIAQELEGGTGTAQQQQQHVNGPMRVGGRVAVPVVAGGTAHGVLMWWELTVRALVCGWRCSLFSRYHDNPSHHTNIHIPTHTPALLSTRPAAVA